MLETFNHFLIVSCQMTFVNLIVETGDDNGNRLHYTGRELEEAGLYYYRAHDPEVGRFLTEDPLLIRWF